MNSNATLAAPHTSSRAFASLRASLSRLLKGALAGYMDSCVTVADAQLSVIKLFR